MTLTLNAPRYLTNPRNPAEQWVEDPETELGFTMPYINGGAAIRVRGYFGVRVGCALDVPTIAVDDLQSGRDYQPRHAAAAGEDLMGVAYYDPDPRDVAGEREWNFARYTGRITAEPVNRFDWDVTLLPAGPWSTTCSLVKLQAIAAQIAKENRNDSMHTSSLAVLRGAPARQYTLNVVADIGTTIDGIRSHTLAHENQHVLDHVTVIRTILGPWDALIHEKYSEHVDYTHSSRADVISYLRSANGWCSAGIPAMLREITLMFEVSGDQYHHTAAGAPCSRRIIQVDADGDYDMTVAVKPKGIAMVGAPIMAIPLHVASGWQWGRDRVPG